MQEIRLKVGIEATDREPLTCPVDGCGDSGGRIGRVEVFREPAGGEDGEEVCVGLDCRRGHRWFVAFIDNGAGGLFYAVRGWTRIEDVQHSVGRVWDEE